MPLTISLLTPFALELDGQPLTLTSRRTEALFVYLLRTGQPQAREVLANLFWDDLPQTQAAGNLRVLIANLHKAVGPYVTITRQSVAFDTKIAFHCDLTLLEQGLAAARREQSGAGGLNQADADKLAQTLVSYQGEFLPGFYLRGGQGFDEWLATEREWLWTRAIAALGDLTNAYLCLGDYRAGVGQAQRLVKFDPLREEGHQLLMQLLAADGQTNTALVHYQRCVQILDQELGAPPSAATTQLFKQIQQGEWQPPRQVAAIQPTVPVTALSPPPHNLPRALTPFVGREAELERLQPYLLDPAYPLVTVAGEGGSGKTRLALAAAQQLLTQAAPAFPDGIWFVPLTTLQRGEVGLRTALAAAIGKALGLAFQGQRPIAAQLLALLQQRRCLLLLDNFEQLLPAEASGEPGTGESSAVDFVIELLEQAPRLQLLVTSRTPLDLSSEFVVRLHGLPVPAVELPADAATYASIRLFAERASRIAEHFQLEEQLSEVATICRFMAGLPLGIELAAAWSASLTPIEIALALQANLDFLATRRRDIPPRQRSMRAVFDHSWQLLTPAAQRVLAQIATFNGGFTSEAARAVVALADSNLAQILDYLVHCALLQQDASGRFAIHPLLRDYAREKLVERSVADEEANAVAQRHSRYYLALAEQAQSQGWYTRADLAPIYAELDNVRQGWQWASQQHDLVGLAQGWLGLWHFYHSSALFQEGEEVLRATLEGMQTHSSADPAFVLLVAQLQVAHASFLNALGQYTEAVTIAQNATAFAETVPDEALKAWGYAAWGTGLYRQAQLPAALACLAQGVTAAQAAGLPLVEADLHKRLANTLQTNHDFTHARQHYAQALFLYRQHKHRPGEADVLNGRGWCSLQQHQLAEALSDLRPAQQIQAAIDDPHGLSMTLINLAIIAERQDDYAQAFACRRQVLDLLQQFDDPYQAALANHGLGLLLSRLGDYAAAEPYYQRALEIDHALGDPGGVAWTQNNLGLLYNHRGEYATARALHEKALQTSIRLGATTTEGLAWSRLGQDYYGLGEFEESYDAYLRAIAIQQKLGQQVWLIESKSGLAATQLALRMENEALSLVQEILDFLAAQSLAGAREPMLVYWNCYQVLHAQADARATAVLRSAYQQIAEQAAQLADPHLQRTFLANIRPHHTLRQEFYRLYGKYGGGNALPEQSSKLRMAPRV